MVLPAPREPRWIIAVMTLFVVMFLSGALLVFYAAIYTPYTLSRENAATARVYATQTGHDNLTATAVVQATATSLAQRQDDYTNVTRGTLALTDSLQRSDSNNWDENDLCAFSRAAYHVSSLHQHEAFLCAAHNTNFGNLAYQVHIKILKGNGGGLAFRANEFTFSAYTFTIYQDGTYDIGYYPNSAAGSVQILDSGESTLISSGLNQENTIAIIARGSTIEFYINGKYLNSVTDSNLKAGRIGLEAINETGNTEVAFTQAQVWTLH